MPNPGLMAAKSQNGVAVQSPDRFPFSPFAGRPAPERRIQELYRRAQQPVNRSLLENVLTEMEIRCQVAQSDLARIPSSGPVLVVANHPFGMLDGAVLGAMLSRVRTDVKIIANSLLAVVPELHEHCFFVDPFRERTSAAMNRHALKQAVSWLRNGGMVAMFPAGEVSHLRLGPMQVADPPWLPAAARLLEITGATALPVYFPGRNSVAFQAVGLLHPRLRTAWLLNEFLGQKGKSVEVRVGSAISPEVLQNSTSPRDAAAYLRWRTYLLAKRRRPQTNWQVGLRSMLPKRRQDPVAAPTPAAAVCEDIAQLSAERCLVENREFSVYLADMREIPHLIQELGRLRELTFRTTGEGTGQRSDLDRFDRHYKHLLLWSRTNRELAGAYRLGLTTEILPRAGVGGLYTSTLFRYEPRVFDKLGPALELGRSFVRPEYQRQYSPLLMLWKGIGRYVAAHPEFSVLFGAVSISSRYNRVSRDLIVRFFRARERGHELGRWITPRRPFRAAWQLPVGPQAGARGLRDVHDLGDSVSDVEGDGKGLPILIKQYAKLGGRIVSFNVDRHFSDVLDGLVLVDLRRADPAALERSMGRDGIAAFRRYHGLSCTARDI
jgi:putative hemolysin